MQREELEKYCKDQGAYAAKVISVKEIEFDPSFRKYCEDNVCGQYGRNYACPPYAGTPQELKERACAFRQAVVFQTVTPLEGGMTEDSLQAAKNQNNQVGDAIQERLETEKRRSLRARAGQCSYCTECEAVKGKPCTYPPKGQISLSAFCVNVASLAETCGMKFQNGENTLTYFGVIFFGDPEEEPKKKEDPV